ncbi:uncharacterized protein LOC133983722 [Scomber scombrus]|uniref:uncharacterized protein LOC133983722 n=1 Tax=Scomber scombrus TaxID=13677 RepID=UPI002DD90B88|nr:uncharacterized protein LOC133983722 [Scomber scombrus]
MASTPSASALTAVLRCRGNIWTRNPPTKRPATSAYSLGLAGGAVRDLPDERSRSHKAPTWETFLQGERIVVGRRLTVTHNSSRVDAKILREKDSMERNTFCHPKLSQSRAHATLDVHSAACDAQNAPVRQLALKLISNLPGTDACSQIVQMIKCEKYAAHICKIVFVQEINDFPKDILKVSITSSCLMENSGQIPSFVLTGWSSVKSTCLSLTTLVSEIMFRKLAVLCRSSCTPDGAPEHLLHRQDAKNLQNDALQANGQIHSPTDLNSSKVSVQKITEDRPD